MPDMDELIVQRESLAALLGGVLCAIGLLRLVRHRMLLRTGRRRLQLLGG